MITNKKIVIILILIFLVLILYIKQIKKEHLEEIDDTIISDLTKIYFSNKKINSESIYTKDILSENLTFRFEDLNLNKKLCLSSGKCITGEMINTLNNSDNIANNYMYLPNSPNKIDNNIIWNNIFSQINPNNTAAGALKAVNDTWLLSHNSTKWNNKHVYQTTKGNALQYDGSGIEITIPPPTSDMKGDFTVLWLQVLNDDTAVTKAYCRWSTFKVYDYTNPSNIRSFGKHVAGGNIAQNISPDGSTSNVQYDKFSWWPVPINLSGNTSRKLMISTFWSNANGSTWYSGFAFSTNPWNHCQVNAKSLCWQVNSLDASGKVISTTLDHPNMIWNIDDTSGDYWNKRGLGYFKSNTGSEFRIPFVNSQKDKIFYLIEHNNNWGPSISFLEIKTINEVFVNIGNLYTTLDNPFARHNNSKSYHRYYGIVIPKQHLPIKGTPNDNFITLRLTVPTNAGYGLYFREVGTHDLSPF
jgi:hypothetical protein